MILSYINMPLALIGGLFIRRKQSMAEIILKL